MSREPVEGALKAIHFLPRGRGRGAIDHDHRQAEAARGGDLGHRPTAPGILRYNQLHPMALHQRAIIPFAEGAALHQNGGFGQGCGRLWGVNKTQDIVVLGRAGKRGEVHSPDGQHHPHRRVGGQRGGGAWDVGHGLPAIPALGLPRRAGEGEKRCAGLSAGHGGVGAHLGGKRVGGVDHMAYTPALNMACQPPGAAKPPHTYRQGLTAWPGNPPCQRNGCFHAKIGKALAQCGGLLGAAENEEVGAHG